MTSRRRTILGALALCAASLCAFGAANASAATTGLTAVTCKEVKVAGTGEYNNSNCRTPKVAGNFETTEIPELTTTELEGKAIAPGAPHETAGVSKLRGTVSLVKVVITCEEATVTGHVTNTKESEFHRVHGTKAVVDYKKCHAALQSNEAKKCEVESITGTAGVKGTIATNPLTATTGLEHRIKFSPETVGANFAEFKILKGECLGATAKVTVTGSVNGTANTETHSHITFAPATNKEEGAELKANGAEATYEGTNTAWMKGEPTKPVGLQTGPWTKVDSK